MIQRYLSFELILGSPRNFTETSTSLKGKKSCDTATLDSLIVPFQSPFWLNNKNWFVTCDYIPLAMKTILYTTPICTEVEVQAESPVFEVSSTKPNCRLILHRNYNMIYNIENETLIKLNLKGNPGRYCTTVSAAIQIYNDKTITKMDLHEKSIDDIRMKFLADAVYNNEVTSFLICSIDDHGFIVVLTILELSHNRIGNNGAQYLYDAFKENKTLIKLNLEGNPGSYCATVSAAIQIRDNKVLTILELSYNQISNNGLQCLDDALKENKTLIKLNLEGNSGSYYTTVSAAIQIRNDKITVPGFSTSNNSIHTKRALLIGNNKYKKNSQLQYCINDAEDLANKLYKIDFEITIGTNLTYEQMNRIIETFNDKINPGDLVLFFFAGHGCQWSHLNFLMPIDDDRIKTNTDLEYRAINAQVTLEKIINRRPSAAIFLLDCCRNSFVCESTNFNCLSSMRPIGHSFISFACTANKVALDKSKNGRNSLFTSHLLQHIDQPNFTIGEIMYGVCNGMMNETNNDQCPFRVSSLRRKVYLNQQFPIGQSIPLNHFNINTKWRRHGITMAGGNGYGNQLNQLSQPRGIYVDDDHQTVYIADWLNHRIVVWKYRAKSGQVVAGGNGYGNRSDQLYFPTDVIVDKKNNSLIICDQGNRRVVRWSRQNSTIGETIISDIDCYGLTMDKNGDLYVSDYMKNEVRRWKQEEKEEIIVAGGNGKGNHLNQLNCPTYIFVDEDHSIYVSDCDNHRVMKWTKRAKGVVVAGGNGQGNSLTQLSYPRGVAVDQLGNVYVADYDNHRVMRWCEGSKEGSIVVGGNGKGEQSNQFNCPTGLSFDVQGNLYVVDHGNARIQKFHIDLN
ncbi:unnamed protein product [Adineta steineri]|uniref:Caspase family p20 domain-containing protein n=1 Tax=Adineta steineri TaxID=433720 RepID=A0A814HZU2_9BILA|nr:unnamed protein product [Adineta steineri]